VAVTGKDRQKRDDEQSPASEPWHNRTSAVVGASVVGIVVIGLLIMAGTFVARQFNQPEQAPLNFVTPSFSASSTDSSSTPTTTATITSTSPPETTDIDGPSSTSGSPSSSDTSSSFALEDPAHTAWTRPYTPSSASPSAPTTGQHGPRFNVTRTLNP
jgi:cytoskeletal protein RodZ